MRFPRLSPLATAIAALGLLMPSAALGAANHPFLGLLGQPSYDDACGLTFGAGGIGLYVSDYGHDEVVGPTTIAPEAPQGGPCKLAFDPAGNLYVLNWHREVVRYGAGQLQSGAYEVIDPVSPSDPEAPTGLAVDPVSEDLYVAHRTFIAKYAAPVHSGETPVLIGEDEGAAYYGIAFSSFPATNGFLYLPNAATARVDVFDSATATPTGPPLEEIGGEATPQRSFTHLIDSEVLVDNNPTSPSYGHLYLLDNIGYGSSEHPEGTLDEFNPQGDYRGQVKGFQDAEPSGIAIEAASGNLLLTSGNSEASAVFRYGPTAPAHKLTITKAGAGSGALSSTPNGIACGEACAAEFNQGERVTLLATPDARSRFAGWSVSGAEPCPGTGTCTVLLNHDAEVSANFEEPTQETLTLSTTGEGTVTSEPAGISCPANCSAEFAQGRSVTLTAHPAPHSRFAEWQGVGCDEGTQPTCQITMNGAEAISARFEAIPQLPLSITVSGSGEGTVTSYPGGISCPAACSASFDQGSIVYLMAAPAPGSSFAGFTGGGCAPAVPLCAVSLAQAQSLGAEFSGPARGPLPQTAALRLSALRTTQSAAVLRVAVPQPGTLILSGAGLRPLKRELPAGASNVRLGLGAHARARLRRHHRLRLRLTAGFIPAAGGTSSSRTLSIDFHAEPTRAAHPFP